MKTWIVLFLLVLALGVAWGLARDLLSRERGTLIGIGVVTSAETGMTSPKWLPMTPPRYKVRLADGRLVDVATTNVQSVPAGGQITITEWVTPWGQVWYTQRD
jgi:hypothetical protein